MKKLLLFTAGIFLMTANFLTAQTTRTNRETILLGPVVGFGSSWVGYAPGSVTSRPSGYGGIGLIDMKGAHWAWGGQLIFSSEGYRTNYPGYQKSYIPLYLRLPLRAYYFFGKRSAIVRPDIYFGPSVAMKLSEHVTTTNYFGDVTQVQNARNFRLFDAGLDGGAGVNIQLTRSIYFSADLGYYQGITDALKDADDTYNPQQDVDLNLSLLFDLK